MSNEKKCLRCGGVNLMASDFQSTGKIYACPKQSKLATLLTTGVVVGGNVCFDCGHVELSVDTKKAKALAKKS